MADIKNKQDIQPTVVTLKSAQELSPESVEEIVSTIQSELLEVHTEVDPSLIGGFIADYGDLRFDYSFKGCLDRIERQLKTELQKANLDERDETEDAFSAAELLHREEVLKMLQSVPHGTINEVGRVLTVSDGVCVVRGLPHCRNQELLLFGEDSYGLAMNLESDQVGVVLFGAAASVRAGDLCVSTGKTLSVPTGEKMFGRVVNALGLPIDGKGPIESDGEREVETASAPIIQRQSVNAPLYTGITAIDAMIPVGRGQRELIIGDRRCGKTSIAVDTILRQKDQHVFCVYVAIGQRNSSVAEVVKRLTEAGAMDYTCVMVASAAESAAMQYVAPYAGTAIAEAMMYQGKDVLIVYDDLSKHAVAYRAISLLLRRPPGREAYPGDIFYIHSRLLERSAHLSEEMGGGSLTALPIIETQGGNISAYVPTNVISITDGQIFLDTDRFFAGQRPAVNEGLSVSRVGGAAQRKAMKKVAGSLRLTLSQASELEAFTRLNSESDSATMKQVRRGRVLRAMLTQPLGQIRRMPESVALIHLAQSGNFDEIEEQALQSYYERILEALQSQESQWIEEVDRQGSLDDEHIQQLENFYERFAQSLEKDASVREIQGGDRVE